MLRIPILGGGLFQKLPWCSEKPSSFVHWGGGGHIPEGFTLRASFLSAKNLFSWRWRCRAGEGTGSASPGPALTSEGGCPDPCLRAGRTPSPGKSDHRPGQGGPGGAWLCGTESGPEQEEPGQRPRGRGRGPEALAYPAPPHCPGCCLGLAND